MKQHTISCEYVHQNKTFKVKVTQQLNQFNIGHYAGYIEHKKHIIGVFRSTNAPKNKITLLDLDKEVNRFFK
jgi:hypothetical protein